MRTTPQILMLERAADSLGSFSEELVFVGGCVVETLLTSPVSPAPRPTEDVDAIVRAATYADFARVGEELRRLGFDHRPDEKVICRWFGHGLTFDVMPTAQDVLGFGNRWYLSAMQVPLEVELPSGRQIRVIDAPHFLATKLAAFSDRGRNDPYISADLEDVVAVVDGRVELVAEVRLAAPEVREYVREQIAALLARPAIVEVIEGHLGSSVSSVDLVLGRLRDIV